MFKQLIIARRDLDMSPGKLAAQVSHASMAFLTTLIRERAKRCCDNQYLATDPDTGKPVLYRRGAWAKEASERGEEYFYAEPVNSNDPYGKLKLSDSPKIIYSCSFQLEQDLYEDWINGKYTKVICGARDKSRLLRAVEKAKELDMQEGRDYFLIYDTCRTELEPEEERGTLTCIGFKPMEAGRIDQIGKRYHLW